ncbi:putative zinc finger protein C06E1.8 [Trichinella murrelli]|uniref:Putative zinc finger protein C06E1.8 n=1 Tax=Trichinella murrelli TaxID=144512 RepID=A0A0V0U384_9BILA|nr:putative zinc finger protein C06E1.8 [Trichinella murrelli]
MLKLNKIWSLLSSAEESIMVTLRLKLVLQARLSTHFYNSLKMQKASKLLLMQNEDCKKAGQPMTLYRDKAVVWLVEKVTDGHLLSIRPDVDTTVIGSWSIAVGSGVENSRSFLRTNLALPFLVDYLLPVRHSTPSVATSASDEHEAAPTRTAPFTYSSYPLAGATTPSPLLPGSTTVQSPAAPLSDMPYRSELRRPDLKGTFRCSLCNKIFCHSSSLSRHRMQAHFKSYTCTLCNKEITNKTSLHIHMQAMATGSPGNVSIIAKSCTSPPMASTPIGVLNTSAPSGIFPPVVPSRDELINRLRERAMVRGIANPPSGLDLTGLFPGLSKFLPRLDDSPSADDIKDDELGLADLNGNSLMGASRSGCESTDEAESFSYDGMEISCTAEQSPELGVSCGDEAGKSDLDGSRLAQVCNDLRMKRAESAAPDSNQSDIEESVDMGNGQLPLTSTDEAASEELSSNNSEQQPQQHQAKQQLENQRHREQQHGTNEEQDQHDLPLLRSAISASPMSSLLYQKKLHNTNRHGSKNSRHAGAAASNNQPTMYPSPAFAGFMYSAVNKPFTQHLFAAAAAAAAVGYPLGPIATGGYFPFASFFPDLSEAGAGGGQTVSNSSNNNNNSSLWMFDGGCTSAGNTSGGATTTAAASTTTATSSSQGLSPVGSVGSGASPKPTSTSGGGSGELLSVSGSCFDCHLSKGKVAQAENRCRFLESKTTSQESKISRLETRISTLEANNRRFDAETHLLRDHCEKLERRILECQDRALRYLQSQNYNAESTEEVLLEILETCQVYK